MRGLKGGFEVRAVMAYTGRAPTESRDTIKMMQPDPTILTKAVDVIVSAVNLLRIILLGSGARDQLRVDSDLDLTVVVKDGTHRRNTAVEIRKALRVFDNDFDVIVATEDDLKRYGDNFSLVYYPALREGRTIYAG